GFADIVTGPGPGGGPHVRIWNGKSGGELRGFFAYNATFSGGVHVGAGDINGDGKAEVITAPGPGKGAGTGNGPDVKMWDGATGTELAKFLANSTVLSDGIYVATQVPQNRMAIDAPIANSIVGNPFIVLGWALSEGGSSTGIGVSAIHVWAYPAGGG